MAACAASTCVSTGVPSLSVSKKAVRAGAVQASFAGLRSGNKVDCLSLTRRSFESQTAITKSASRTTCYANPGLVISLSTGALLFLGRFVFLPFQRDNVSDSPDVLFVWFCTCASPRGVLYHVVVSCRLVYVAVVDSFLKQLRF